LEDFFNEISVCGGKIASLSTVPPYLDEYIIKPLHPAYPIPLTDLHDETCKSLKFNRILDLCEKIEIRVTAQQATNVEQATRDQADNRLWHKYRAG